MVEEGDDGARYRMLETIREYAREKLAARGRVRRGIPLRSLLRDGQGGQPRSSGPRAGSMDAPASKPTRQPAAAIAVAER